MIGLVLSYLGMASPPHGPPNGLPSTAVLGETGDFLLTEAGDFIIQE